MNEYCGGIIHSYYQEIAALPRVHVGGVREQGCQFASEAT